MTNKMVKSGNPNIRLYMYCERRIWEIYEYNMFHFGLKADSFIGSINLIREIFSFIYLGNKKTCYQLNKKP